MMRGLEMLAMGSSAVGIVVGMGVQGYVLGIQGLVHKLKA